jgi:hypothetical protein
MTGGSVKKYNITQGILSVNKLIDFVKKIYKTFSISTKNIFY